MAIRDEVRTLKANTLEEFRQKSNELSIRNVGDDNLLSSNLGDKTESFTATSGQKFFELQLIKLLVLQNPIGLVL